MICNNVLDLIGNTPLVKLDKIKEYFGVSFNIYAKFERNNPSGSIKDRIAKEIILDGLKHNLINENTEIIEATSGNTGISLAMICAYLNLKCTIVMPENASKERVQMMKAFNANVILTDANLGMDGSVKVANELALKNKNSFVCNQFNNVNGINAHYKYTANEIINDLNGKVDVFLAGFGTSGTLIGVSKRLKEFNPSIETIGIEPLSSPLLTQNKSGIHKIQGIGANFVPGLFDNKLVDRIIDISDEESYLGARLLANMEGLFCGISSGAVIYALSKLDKKIYSEKNVVIILPDNGERYLSVGGLF